jgi:hypothetical protein
MLSGFFFKETALAQFQNSDVNDNALIAVLQLLYTEGTMSSGSFLKKKATLQTT